MSSILNIAISGLNDASVRVANAASNIVNASSTSPLPDSPAAYTGYAPTDVVSLSSNAGGFDTGVTTQTQPRNPAYNVAFDASSPNANANGFIATPNVDTATELVASIAAQASYAASAAVVKIAEKLDKALLDIKT